MIAEFYESDIWNHVSCARPLSPQKETCDHGVDRAYAPLKSYLCVTVHGWSSKSKRDIFGYGTISCNERKAAQKGLL